MTTRNLLLCALLLTPLVARENPFFSAGKVSQSDTVTSNIVESRPPLGSVSYDFPNQSRLLKEVTFTVQNLDGSIEVQKVQIDKTIDWHKPIILTQGNTKSPSTASNTSSTADFGIISMKTFGKQVSVQSSLELLRHFALSKPNRIVIDFKSDQEFKLLERSLNAVPYLSASVGTHGKFIRMIIQLDGRYSYTFSRSGNNITITCK